MIIETPVEAEDEPVEHEMPVHAVYTSTGLPHYDANPLITALRPIRSPDQWREDLTRIPKVAAELRSLPAYLRIHLVPNLKGLFVVDAKVQDVADQISLIVRAGYVARNPTTPNGAERRQRAYERDPKATDRSDAGFSFTTHTPMFSTALIGLSGSGKTTTLQQILGLEPQYIVHDDLRPRKHQVVWLYVSVPPDGETRDLLVAIVRELHRVLGTRHVRQTVGKSETELLDLLGRLSKTYAIGLLVLDEIQNIAKMRGDKREEALQMFQEMFNQIRVPIFVTGTFRAKHLFGNSLTHVRRTSILGGAFWTPMTQGPAFDALLAGIWDCLVLANPGALTKELSNAVHMATQGVRAFVVDMFMVAQIVALRCGIETLTSEFFSQVTKNYFPMVQPILRILRSKDNQQLVKLDDVIPYDIDELLAQAREADVESIKAGMAKPDPTRQFMAQAVTNVALYLKIDEDSAYRLVDSIASTQRFDTAAALTQAAIKTYVMTSTQA